MALTHESQYVIESYKAHFEGKKDIVLYGVGINTKVILTEICDPNIIGLMDPLCEGKCVMGKPVFSPQEASQRAGLIVIVARPAVVHIIFERIRDLESIYHIPIYNIEGKRLIEEEEPPFSIDLPYWNCSDDILKQKIALADVVSFDVFDTLLTRDVLRPADLFFFLGHKLRNKGIPCPSFAIQRQAVEAQLSQTCVPTLEQIYELLQRYYTWDHETAYVAYSLELELESRACHARIYMRDIYHYALQLHKTVILVSDMYLRREQFEVLLRNAGYTGYHRLYISCEQQATKASGKLFELVKKDFSGHILHIGDNPQSDDMMARAHGFLTYPIFSPYEMLLHSSMGKLAAIADTPDKMLTLGILTRKLFDHPFSLGPTKGVVAVEELAQLGFSFLGPVISCFVRWMCGAVWDKNYDLILFSARDGYVIEQLYRRRWVQAQKHLPKGIYFKTSRRAVTVASIQTEQDILELLLSPYETTMGELLAVRFGVMPDEADRESAEQASSMNNPADVERFILRYKEAIFEHATLERKNYLKYIQHIGLDNCKNVVLYDFCSKGTVQYHLTKLLPSGLSIIGIYFATLDLQNAPNYQTYHIITMFGNCTRYEPRYSTVKQFTFLEAVLSDSYESLMCCNEDGSFQYEENPVAYRDFQNIAKIQDGILDFDQALSIWDDVTNRSVDSLYRDFCDMILNTIFNGNCIIDETIKKAIVIDGMNDFKPPYQVLT